MKSEKTYTDITQCGMGDWYMSVLFDKLMSLYYLRTGGIVEVSTAGLFRQRMKDVSNIIAVAVQKKSQAGEATKMMQALEKKNMAACKSMPGNPAWRRDDGLEMCLNNQMARDLGLSDIYDSIGGVERESVLDINCPVGQNISIPMRREYVDIYMSGGDERFDLLKQFINVTDIRERVALREMFRRMGFEAHNRCQREIAKGQAKKQSKDEDNLI